MNDKLGMVVDEVIKDSIADEIGIKKGDKVLKINNVKPRDIIEYSYIINDEEINLLVEHNDGVLEEYEIEKDFSDDLGIVFNSAVFDKLKRCLNHCIFCFVDQQPDGLRDSLYVKDDDWRLSYIQGTYVTLTNFLPEDWDRIEKYHISPLFVSLHTTNPELRVKMLKNPNAANIMEQLKRFKKMKTMLHLQIVLCPGFNDGDELRRTFEDLKSVKSIIKSVAVVPVGISKYRKEKLKHVDKKIALETIDIIDKFNSDIKKQIAMASDEFFILADKEVPSKKYYGEFLQIEDGVGSIRLLKDSFEKCLKKMKKKLKKPSKITIVTASTAAKILRELTSRIKVSNLDIEVLDVKNKFFGSDINVAGLIVASDIIDTIKDKKIEHLIIPSVMLKKTGEGYEEIFLDGLTTNDIKKAKPEIKIHILDDYYSFDEILNLINKL